MQFLPGASWIAIGGLIAAAGPVLIHLLNRRRFKVIHWAAMDFLLQAVQRNRKILEIRDLILLLLRTACVLLVGLALAGPYFSCSSNGANPNDPLHAILIVDNGLSMGYEKGGKTLLDEAKTRAKAFVDKLPSRSRIAVIPLCGSANDFDIEPQATKEDAKAALEKVELVDRSDTATKMRDLALQAMEKAPDLPAKRVVFFSDQQASKWPKGALAEEFKRIPDLQLVAIEPAAGDQLENTWIQDFRVADDFANPQSPATFVAHVRHQGPPRDHVEVTLTLSLPDGESVSQNQVVDLDENSEGKELRFTQAIPVLPKEDQPLYVAAKISLPEDHLDADNARYLSVPVLAKVPAVFVDQLGKDENVNRNRIGETEPMRRMLIKNARRGESQLFNVKHVKINEVNRDLLQGARVAVVAGVASPGDTVPDLIDYVRNGGQLLIAAGADFDPAAWDESAWKEGDGILPAYLLPAVGHTPEEAPNDVTPFFLDYDTLSKTFIENYDNSEEDLRQFYHDRYFFKAINSDVSEATMNKMVAAEKQRLLEQNHLDRETTGKALAAPTKTADDLSLKAEHSISELAERSRPRVLGSFTNKVPFLIERRLGKGRVLFMSTGMASNWNDLKNDDGKLMFVLILWPMLKETLPQRSFDTAGDIEFPISDAERTARFEVWRPGSKSGEPVGVEALNGNQSGLVIRGVTQRGIYRIASYRDQGAISAANDTGGRATSETPLAVNGPAEASELGAIKADTL
ncbi:MAG TPA: BatA domain-containing protein, partial [Pirellulales bacterium]|nr:BatA domain-containing protein [Pirellulales bacterium]